MAGVQDFQEFCDDFSGVVASLPASADPGSPWLIDDTSSAGTPTYTTGTSVATLTLASTSEVENVCLSFGDALEFDIDDVLSIEFSLKGGQAALDAASSLAFGLASARNDAIDSIGEAALFRVIGSDSTTAVVAETDDGSTNNDDVATGTSLAAAYKKFVINFAGGKADVRFFVDGKIVASSTTFSMANYSGGLQPFVQLQKTADTNVDAVVIDYIKVRSRRA